MSVAESPCSSYETDQGSTSTLRPRLLPRKRKSTCFRKMVRYIAKGYLPRESDRQYYADRYRCCPPPLFIPTITLAEASQYVYKQYWLLLHKSKREIERIHHYDIYVLFSFCQEIPHSPKINTNSEQTI